MRTFAPSPALAALVRDWMVVETPGEVTRLRLPDTGIVLGVRYRGSASVLGGAATQRLPDVSVAGMATSARTMRTSAGGGVLLARFRPGAASRIFAAPLHEIFGDTVGLDALVARRDVVRLHTRVLEARSDAERIALLEAFLVRRMRECGGRDAGDPIVTAAVRAITSTRGAVRVADLAAQLGIGVDTLEKRFRRTVGATPKQLASIVRLRHALDSWRPNQKLTDLALAAGYYDQSHFNRELRAVTGKTPSAFLREYDERVPAR